MAREKDYIQLTHINNPQLNQSQINILKEIENRKEYGFVFPNLKKGEHGFSGKIKIDNTMPLLLQEIFVKIQIGYNLAILSYKYTHPNGGSNGYIIETFKV